MSDRLLIQYSIEIKQLSLSETEYQFWEQMKQINETGGDIFEKQPFSIVSNIHNISNPGEQVLGYFQVSAVEKKLIYITPDEISKYDLPVFQYDCPVIKAAPGDYPGLPMTFDKIYNYFSSAGSYFIGPIYGPFGGLDKLTFERPECADCTVNGSLTKPDFWIDLDLPKNRK